MDRRRNILTVTKAGSRLLDRLAIGLSRVQGAVLAPLTANERQTFVRLLRKLT